MRNPQYRRAVGYCNFLTTINLYLHVYPTVPSDVMGRPSGLICHLELRHVFLRALSVRVSSSLTLRGFYIIYFVVFLRQFYSLAKTSSSQNGIYSCPLLSNINLQTEHCTFSLQLQVCAA